MHKEDTNFHKGLPTLLEAFEHPGRAYRGKPFWAWNGELEKDELIRQARIMKEMGLGGFFMHARAGDVYKSQAFGQGEAIGNPAAVEGQPVIGKIAQAGLLRQAAERGAAPIQPHAEGAGQIQGFQVGRPHKVPGQQDFILALPQKVGRQPQPLQADIDPESAGGLIGQGEDVYKRQV